MTEKKNTLKIPTPEEFSNTINVLGRRSRDLETEVGRLTMINRAYEEQFGAMMEHIDRLKRV